MLIDDGMGVGCSVLLELSIAVPQVACVLLLRLLGLHRVEEQLTTRMFTALEFSLTVFMGASAKGIVVIVSSNDGSVDTLLRNSDTLGQLMIGIVSQLQGVAEAHDSIV